MAVRKERPPSPPEAHRGLGLADRPGPGARTGGLICAPARCTAEPHVPGTDSAIGICKSANRASRSVIGQYFASAHSRRSARLCVRWPDSISATRTGNSAFVAFACCAAVVGGFARLGRITVLRVVADRRSRPPHPGVPRRARGLLRACLARALGEAIGYHRRLGPLSRHVTHGGQAFSRAVASDEFGEQLLALRGLPRPVGVGGRAMRCSPTPSVHGGESGRVVRDERGRGGGGEGGAGRPGLTRGQHR